MDGKPYLEHAADGKGRAPVGIGGLGCSTYSLAMGGDGQRRGRMFSDNNRIRFEAAVDEASAAWWRRRFEKPFGLSPEDVGDLLSKSWEGDKRMVVTALDGRAERFAIRVEGAWGPEEFWFHARTLDLHGSAANADRMFVSPARQGHGQGRRFMADLVAVARLLGLSRITLDAEHVGRYAWLRAGFLPDRGSWRTMQVEVQQRLAAAIPDIGEQRFLELLRLARSPDRVSARELAALTEKVTSRELFGPDGRGTRVPLGRALFLEIGSGWSGELDLSDQDSMAVADAYLAAAP